AECRAWGLARADAGIGLAAPPPPGHAVRAHGNERHRRHDGEGAWTSERGRGRLERAVGRHCQRRALFALRTHPRRQCAACRARGGGRRDRRDGRRSRAIRQSATQLCRSVRQERSRPCLWPTRDPARPRASTRIVDHALSCGPASSFGADHYQPRAAHRCRGQEPRRMSAILGLPANLVYATVAIYALLVIASIVVGVLRWKNPGERYSELASRTDSWWWMIGAFTLCILLNQTVAISYLALKEYLWLIPTRRIWMFLFLPPLLVLRGRSEGFLRAVGTISSGLMMTVFTLSHWHGCSCRATSSIRSLAESGSCSSLWC